MVNYEIQNIRILIIENLCNNVAMKNMCSNVAMKHLEQAPVIINLQWDKIGVDTAENEPSKE